MTPRGASVEGGITDEARSALLRAALALVGRQEMRAALASAAEPGRGTPKAAVNALHALRKHRDPTDAVGRAAYRSAVPWVATAIADDCLSRTIEELGDASEDPTREQLLSALDRVRDQYSDVTIAVMLATVAGAGMPASDLCFAILSEDERFGLSDAAEPEADPDDDAPDHPNGDDDPGHPDPTAAGADGNPARSAQPTSGTEAVAVAQRDARRVRRRQEAEAKRKRSEVSRQAAEQARRARKQGRSGSPPPSGQGERRPPPVVVSSAPRLTRRALLTPAEKEEFDTGDPWVAGVVVAWVPFDAGHPDELSDLDQPGTSAGDGKERPCVVIAGSPEHLLVRPGYSEGGLISRDWRSTPLRHWRSAGFERPTWVDHGARRISREGVHAPQFWLVPDDWNALW
jgi:hypothetical protein